MRDDSPALAFRNNSLHLPVCPLVAREVERQALAALWRSSRLVTLYGQSGVGKSTLARAAAHDLDHEFPARVLCLDAGGVTSGRAVLRLLARVSRQSAAGIADNGWRMADGGFSSNGPDNVEPAVDLAPKSQSANRHPRFPTFVLLDDLPTNAHSAARGLLQWLVANPEVHLLIVSGRPLELVGERVLPLAPLAVPPPGETSAPSVDFLLACAERARPDRPPVEEKTAAALCRALDGLPAALEAAAALVGTLPAPEIARVAREAPLSLSIRGRSLRTHLAATWGDLSPAARDYLSANALWPVGFGDEAGADLNAGEQSPSAAAHLLQLGLLRLTESGARPRCRMSPFMRAFILETGAAHAPERQEGLARCLLRQAERLSARRGLEELSSDERKAMRWAWRWFAGRRDGNAVRRFAFALAGPLRHELGEPAEALEMLQSALAYARTSDFGFWILDFGLPTKASGDEAVVGVPNPKSKIQNPKSTTVPALEAQLAATELRLGRLEAAEARLRTLLDGPLEPGFEARACLRLGAVLNARGCHAEALQVRFAAMDRLRAVGDEACLAWALLGLAEDQRRLGHSTAASAALEESGALFSQLGCSYGRAAALAGLGALHAGREEWGEAAWHARESQRLAEAVGDRPGRARALQLSARIVGRDDPARGVALATEAVALWEEMGRPVDLAAALQDLSGLARAAGGPEERSLLPARSALRLARHHGCPALEAAALLSLAETYRRSGRPDLALEYAGQAHRSCDRTDDVEIRRRCEQWQAAGLRRSDATGRQGSGDRGNCKLSIEDLQLTIAASPEPTRPVPNSPLLLIRLLGSLEVAGPMGVLSTANLRPKEQRVLARLALETGRLVPRDELLDLFWPEAAVGAAERSLRTVVSSLRGSLRTVLNGEAPRLITGRLDGYCLERTTFAVDAARFAEAIQTARSALQGQNSTPEALAACREAVELYRGDLLSAFPYEDWCLALRERLRDDYLDALFQLARHALVSGSTEEARSLAARMVEVDATEERAHRLLMRCYARLDRPADALRQFARCRAALHDELAARPAAATLALLESIRAGAALLDDEAGT